jgi:hypothetical protein
MPWLGRGKLARTYSGDKLPGGSRCAELEEAAPLHWAKPFAGASRPTNSQQARAQGALTTAIIELPPRQFALFDEWGVD